MQSSPFHLVHAIHAHAKINKQLTQLIMQTYSIGYRILSNNNRRGSSITQRPRNALCQLKSCEMLHDWTKNCIIKACNMCMTFKVTQGP